MDTELRAHFGALSRPSLPPFFAERCARRAVSRASALPLSRRQRLALRVYWCLAAVASASLLLTTDFPAGAPTWLTVAFGAGAILVALPVFLLARLRGGVFSFVLRVLE